MLGLLCYGCAGLDVRVHPPPPPTTHLLVLPAVRCSLPSLTRSCFGTHARFTTISLSSYAFHYVASTMQMEAEHFDPYQVSHADSGLMDCDCSAAVSLQRFCCANVLSISSVYVYPVGFLSCFMYATTAANMFWIHFTAPPTRALAPFRRFGILVRLRDGHLRVFLSRPPDTGPTVEGELHGDQVALPPPLPEAPPRQKSGQPARGQQEVQRSRQGLQGQEANKRMALWACVYSSGWCVMSARHGRLLFLHATRSKEATPAVVPTYLRVNAPFSPLADGIGGRLLQNTSSWYMHLWRFPTLGRLILVPTWRPLMRLFAFHFCAFRGEVLVISLPFFFFPWRDSSDEPSPPNRM